MKRNDRDDRTTSISLDRNLFVAVKVKLIENNLTLKNLVEYASHLFVSGSIPIDKIKTHGGENDN